MKNLKLINFKSPPANNYFAPTWNYFIYENFILKINFKKIKTLILNKKKEILKKFPNVDNDGYTGLGKNSLTARYNKYNLLSIKDNEILKLKKEIIQHHNLFLKTLNLDPFPELYIQCWANVMKKGEKINPHIHGTSPSTYLGGHICIQSKDTSTYYINPINQINEPEIYKSNNEIGKITLFQNSIPHYTDINLSSEERITIAFDLCVDKNIINNNYIKLY